MIPGACDKTLGGHYTPVQGRIGLLCMYSLLLSTFALQAFT